MGHSYLDVSELPLPGDIVWCMWPYDSSPDQPCVRPVLVRASQVVQIDSSGQLIGIVDVSYGTGTIYDSHKDFDLIIEPLKETKLIGLHKPTRFELNPKRIKQFAWSDEYFLPPQYLKNASVFVGSLSPSHRVKMRELLTKRGIAY